MRAFIVRPFGPRDGIDFDLVQRSLIDPALARTGIVGDTTQQFVEAGNIRVDMFEQLLLAELVIADISVHNANVFYELGIRHALRARQTLLIRARVSKPRPERAAEDEVPFDLRTDRYLEYEHTSPADSVAQLVEAIEATRDGRRTDSPVFLSLPGLAEPERSRFAPVPGDFAEEVRRARDRKAIAHLVLLAEEAATFAWALEGCRAVSSALFDLRAWEPARRTLENIRRAAPNDPHANLHLATVYQRLGDLTQSDLAIARVLDNPHADRGERSESLALQGSNEKARWVRSWQREADAGARQQAALTSVHLASAIASYREAFALDLNKSYPGLVALSLLTIRKDLIEQQPTVWTKAFDTEEDAAAARREIDATLSVLAGAVRLALDAAEPSEWTAIGRADYQFLMAKRATVAVAAYKEARPHGRPFHNEAARKQLEIFADLALRTDRVAECIAVFDEPEQMPPTDDLHVVVFSGQRIDALADAPRFPSTCVEAATREIRKALQELRPQVGVAAAASGGDLIFHAVCADLGIETVVRLVMPPGHFVNESVATAGPDWVARFWTLIKQKQADGFVAVLSEHPDLPAWLRRRPDYSVWQRANRWMLNAALAMKPNRCTVLALWDGEEGEPGGTGDLVERAKELGATPMIIDPADICR